MATRIEDAGQKVGGARKDKWRERALDLADLGELGVREAERYVVKEHVWPVPDYAALVAAGMDAKAAALIKIIRDLTAVSPDLTQKEPGTRMPREPAEARADYVRILGIAQEAFKDARTIEDVVAAARRIPAMAGIERIRMPDPAARNLLLQAYRTRSGPFGADYKDIARAKNMVDKDGFPNKVPVWRKGLTFIANPRDGKWLAYNAKRRIVASGFDDEEKLATHLEKAHTATKAKGAAGAAAGPAKPPERAHCENVVRSGLPDYRGGRSVSSQEFIDAFGFKSVEFGNWVPQDERQWMLDTGFDCLHDLAETLGFDPRDLSLGGVLSAAFGARGNGKAVAHYEPTLRIFNMTRMRGAGALAHEFGHALDDLAGQIGSGSEGGLVYATGGREQFRTQRGGLSGLGPEAEAAWHAMIDSLRMKPRTRSEAVEDLRSRAAAAQSDVDRAVDLAAKHCERYEEGARDKGWLKKVEAYRAGKAQLAANLTRKADDTGALPDGSDFGMRKTDFLKEAVLLTGENGYHARPIELFARAFEAAVFDAIAERGGRSDYLVYGVEAERYADKTEWAGNSYPTGEERATFLANVRRLAAAMAGPVADLSAKASPAPGI